MLRAGRYGRCCCQPQSTLLPDLPPNTVHGGPGAGCSYPNDARFFDLSFWRVVLHDQRGAPKSKPAGCMAHNTTWDLVADIERIREHLSIDKWAMAFGGSWGSTLCLAYAETHPDKVDSLVLRGIFLFSRAGMHWLFQEGASEMYPDAYEAYAGHIPACERHALLAAYHRRVMSEDRAVCIPAAREFVRWECSISLLKWEPAKIDKLVQDETFTLSFARAECEYFVNGGFFAGEDEEADPGNTSGRHVAGAMSGNLPWLLRHADRIADKPVAIVHGRQDIVCRPRAAWELHHRLPKSTLTFVHDAGHSSSEPGTVDGLIRGVEYVKEQLAL